MLYKVHCENIAEGDSVLIPHLASTGAGLGRNLTNNGSLWPIFRWFKFTLKPPYSIAHDKLRLAIWDTFFWTF